ncbi:MAG: RNA-binding protein hfq [Cyanobacteria bacterium P01_A01_bin.123]
MATELEVGLPSVHQFQQLIREKQTIDIKMVTGDLLSGTLRWQDPHCMCLDTNDGEAMVLWRSAIAYIKVA